MRGLATILAVVALAACATGCAATCGIIPEQGFMTDGGYVAFSTPVGNSQIMNVPLVDSNAAANETVTGSTLTGTDAAAFKVLSSFPMSLTAGNVISVTVEFTPQHVGTSNASLILDTATMGPSPISLQGTAN